MVSGIQFLRKMRKLEGLTRNGLATKLGLPFKTVNYIEQGEIDRIDLKSLVKLADYFGLVITLSARLEVPEGLGLPLEKRVLRNESDEPQILEDDDEDAYV